MASNMFVYGSNAGYGAINANSSNFIGYQAGYNVTNANYSNFFGQSAGYQATGASVSNFIGYDAGYQATNAQLSNFIGWNAGYQATNAASSNFIGTGAGQNATTADFSNFIGQQAGYQAIGATQSTFIGYDAGMNSVNSSNSNFLGQMAGYNSTGSSFSNFLGYRAGNSTTGATYSTLIGFQAGMSFGTANNIGSNNIIIGTNINLSAATTNSINIGGVLFGINTYSTTSGNPSITPVASGKIGIGVVTPTEGLDVALNARFRTIGAATSAGALYYTSTGVLTSNTSDGRLKHNVQTLTNALDKVKQLRGVSYDWIDGSGPTRIGFIAQEVEAIVPELTFVNKNSPENYMGIHYENTVALLVEAVKELSSGSTLNEYLQTQTILAEDNNIKLNYSGTPTTALGGGITVLHGMGVDLSSELIIDANGDWTTNNDFIPNKITLPAYTPSGSTDTNGNLGNVTRDDDYLYVRTSTGWKRTNLENF